MIARLNDLSLVEHIDDVRIHDRCQSVGDEQSCPGK